MGGDERCRDAYNSLCGSFGPVVTHSADMTGASHSLESPRCTCLLWSRSLRALEACQHC